MRVLAEKDGKLYGAITIETPGDLVSPFPGTLFPCMIWDHEGHFTELERSQVANKLLEAGCQYAVCGGMNCEAWHDTIDIAFFRRHGEEPETVQDAAFVMTTWHKDESPDEVAFFFVVNTNFDGHDFSRFLVLHVGDGPS